MRRRVSPWVFAALCFSLRAGSQPIDEEGAASTPQAARAAFAAAFSERFVACYEAEGNALTPDDRAVIAEATAPLGVALVRGLGDGDCEESEESVRRCAEAVRALACDDLARRMETLGAPAAAPPWAAGYARTLAERVAACYQVELDGATLTSEDRAGVDAFREQLARSLGMLESSGRCRVVETEVPACALSVRTLSCDALAARADEPTEGLARSLTPPCARMLRCDGIDAIVGEGVDANAAPDDASETTGDPEP